MTRLASLKGVSFDPTIQRYLWYAMYIPMTAEPILFFFLAVFIHRPQEKPLPRLSILLIIIGALLTLGYLTNDFHFLAVSFPTGILDDNGQEVNGPIYYMINIFIYGLYIVSFILLQKKNYQYITWKYRWLILVPFLIGLLMIAGSIALAINPEESLPVITAIMSVSLWIYGIRMMVYYLTMARHMVGGLRVLFRAIFMLDLGYFAMGLTEIPLLYVMLYLAVMHGISGVINMLRVREAIRLEAPSWRLNFFQGAVDVVTAALCLIMIRSTKLAVYIYAAGVLYSGCIRVIQAFRKTTSVYVQ